MLQFRMKIEEWYFIKKLLSLIIRFHIYFALAVAPRAIIDFVFK
jgi:hypothetical protein